MTRRAAARIASTLVDVGRVPATSPTLPFFLLFVK